MFGREDDGPVWYLGFSAEVPQPITNTYPTPLFSAVKKIPSKRGSLEPVGYRNSTINTRKQGVRGGVRGFRLAGSCGNHAVTKVGEDAFFHADSAASAGPNLTARKEKKKRVDKL